MEYERQPTQTKTKNDDLEQISMFNDKNTSNNVLNDITSDFSTKDDKFTHREKNSNRRRHRR